MRSKTKRNVAIGMVMLVMALFSTTAFASKSGDFYYSNGVNASVHGYVDLQSKWLVSYVWCNISLQGADRTAVKAKYTLETNKKVIKKDGKLDYKNLSDSYTARKGGANAKWAKLIINYDGKTIELKQKK